MTDEHRRFGQGGTSAPSGRPVDAAGRIERAARAAEAVHRTVLGTSDETPMLEEVCHALVDAGGYRIAWVGLADHDPAKTFRPVARAGAGEGVLAAIDCTWADRGWGSGPTGTAVRSGRPVVIRNVGEAAGPELGALCEQARAHGYAAVCALPLRLDEKILGALTLLDADPWAFEPAEVELLVQLTNYLALGIRVSREHAERQRTAQRLRLVDRALRTLSAGNRVLLRCVEEAQLLAEMCRCIVDVGGYRAAWVGYAQHDAEQSILPMAHAGLDLGILDEFRFTWADTRRGQLPSGVAIRTGKPCVRRDFATDPALARHRAEAQKHGYAAVSAFPLRIEGEVIGTLDILAGEHDAFGDDELAVLEELAADMSFGIANLRIRARHRHAERTIERMAFYDSLTGLPNRARLRDRLTREIERSREHHHPLAVLTLNVDRFREINEVLGYRQGDQLLSKLAERLKSVIEPPAMLARLGVDEFTVLLPGAGADRAEAMADSLARAVEEPFELAGTRVEVRASIGIALFPGHGAEADLLILRSDAAMYQAKRGHTGIAMFSGESEQVNRERLALVADLRRAIEGDQLRLYCQPKVAMQDRIVCGAEALVRWQHPQRGLIAPDRFVPLAERAGLINPLTYWVVNAALGQCYAWREAGLDLPLAVNLSARNLLDPRLLDRLTGLLATWGAEPQWLQFELTESALMEDPAGAMQVLHRLDAMGFPLFVDDFGTGYSSLSYLQRLPVGAVKIDKSFVQAMPIDPDSGVIVRSTIEMVHNIGLEVVAEGTENQLIWNQLAGLGADVAQGSYISEPMPSDEFQAWSARTAWRAARIA